MRSTAKTVNDYLAELPGETGLTPSRSCGR